jgi:hypothetical protein
MNNLIQSKCLSLLRYGIIFWGGDNESTKIFKLQKRILQLMSSVNNHTSCTEIFKDYRILTVACLYILEIICYIKKHKQFLEQNAQVHKYDTRRQLDLHVQFCNADIFRKSVVNRGIQLYNKVPDYIQNLDKEEVFKRESKPFLLQQAFYSVDEYMSF